MHGGGGDTQDTRTHGHADGSTQGRAQRAGRVVQSRGSERPGRAGLGDGGAANNGAGSPGLCHLSRVGRERGALRAAHGVSEYA